MYYDTWCKKEHALTNVLFSGYIICMHKFIKILIIIHATFTQTIHEKTSCSSKVIKGNTHSSNQVFHRIHETNKCVPFLTLYLQSYSCTTAGHFVSCNRYVNCIREHLMHDFSMRKANVWM